MMTCVTKVRALRALQEAHETLRAARRAADAALDVRDAAMVEAHRAGASSREIGEVVGMNQPNVVRSRKRATGRPSLDAELLTPAEALRAAKLTVREFVRAVERGQLRSIEVSPGVHGFRRRDLQRLRSRRTR
jgi:hypothetical protein